MFCRNLRETNHCICQILKFKQLDDILDVVVLFRNGYFLRLAEVCREPECFSDGGSPLVNVLIVSESRPFGVQRGLEAGEKQDSRAVRRTHNLWQMKHQQVSLRSRYLHQSHRCSSLQPRHPIAWSFLLQKRP